MTNFFYSDLFLISVVCLTSSAAIAIAAKFGKSSATSLPQAVGRMFQCIGLTILFYIFDVGAGLMLIDIYKFLSHTFVSHYVIADGLLPYVSLMQALVIGNWLGSSGHPDTFSRSAKSDVRTDENLARR